MSEYDGVFTQGDGVLSPRVCESGETTAVPVEPAKIENEHELSGPWLAEIN